MSASVQSVSVDQAGGTTAELIAAIAGYSIEVLAFLLSVGGAAVTVKSTLQDTTANTVRLTLVGNATAPVVHTYNGDKATPAFRTAKGEGLELVTGTAAAIAGLIVFRYVPV
jgi:hypothetical protein